MRATTVISILACLSWGCVPEKQVTSDLPIAEADGTLCTASFEAARTVAPASLADALRTAQPGDVIAVSPGEVRGSFEVPAGVILVGTGVTVVAEGGAGLRLEGGSAANPTIIRGFSVEVPADAAPVSAITALGGGSVVLDDLTLNAAIGAGIISEGVADLQICNSSIAGQVDDGVFAVLQDLPTVSASDAAIIGLAVTAGERLTKTRVRLSDVEIRDFAGFGAAFVDSDANWTRGSVTGCAGTGIYLSRSSHGWTDVIVADGRGSAAGSPTFQSGWGVVNVDGSQLDTDGLQIVGIPGPGLFQAGSKSQHLGARVVNNTVRGVIVQESVSSTPDDPELLFDQSVIAYNGGAGIQVVDGGGVVFQNGILAESRALPTIGGFGSPTAIISDGIQLNSGTGTSLGNQFRASRAVVYGNGKAGINVQGAGSSLLADGSDTVTVCGATAVDESRWACSATSDGALDCLRRDGPSVTGNWTCSDLNSQTVCTSSDPALAEATSPDFPVKEADAGIPSFCRADTESIVGENGLVVSSGIAAADAAPGFQKAAPSPAGTGYRWTCRSEGGSRICVSIENDRVNTDDFDNPSLTQGSGWTCEYTTDGRRCTWSGFGVATDAEAVGTSSFRPRVEARIFDRDQLLRSGALPVPAVDLQRDRRSVPGLARGVRSIVGENGIVNPDGSMGSRAVVGENGIVGENG